MLQSLYLATWIAFMISKSLDTGPLCSSRSVTTLSLLKFAGLFAPNKTLQRLVRVSPLVLGKSVLRFWHASAHSLSTSSVFLSCSYCWQSVPHDWWACGKESHKSWLPKLDCSVQVLHLCTATSARKTSLHDFGGNFCCCSRRCNSGLCRSSLHLGYTFHYKLYYTILIYNLMLMSWPDMQALRDAHATRKGRRRLVRSASMDLHWPILFVDRRFNISCSAGDKPELLYPEAKQELRSMGYESTLEYVAGIVDLTVESEGRLSF